MNACPTCGQPATRALPPDEGWECRNEACPEFGQELVETEPVPVDLPSPRGPETVEERSSQAGAASMRFVPGAGAMLINSKPLS